MSQKVKRRKTLSKTQSAFGYNWVGVLFFGKKISFSYSTALHTFLGECAAFELVEVMVFINKIMEMGAKAKKAMKKNLKKASSQLVASARKTEAADFLPLEGGPGRKLPEQKPIEDKATVLYIGRIPHGFYEKEMEGFFTQFGKVKRLRIARNKKTGKSKHFGFIELESPEVAKIVADCMHNQLLFEHLLQVHLIPPGHVHPKLWRGFNYRYKPVDWVQIERKQLKKERTLKEHQNLVEKIMKRDLKRKKKIEAAGIEYECPEIVGSILPAPKKIKFDDE